MHAVLTEKKWRKPVENRVKINVDASLMYESHSFVIGMVNSDHEGGFIQAKSIRYLGTVPVLEAKA